MSNNANINDPNAKPPHKSKIPLPLRRTPLDQRVLPPVHSIKPTGASGKSKRTVRRRKIIKRDETLAGYAADDSSVETSTISFFEQTIADLKENKRSLCMVQPVVNGLRPATNGAGTSKSEGLPPADQMNITPCNFPSAKTFLQKKLSIDRGNFPQMQTSTKSTKLESTRLSSVETADCTDINLSAVSNVGERPFEATFIAESEKKTSAPTDSTSRYILSDISTPQKADSQGNSAFGTFQINDDIGHEEEVTMKPERPKKPRKAKSANQKEKNEVCRDRSNNTRGFGSHGEGKKMSNRRGKRAPSVKDVEQEERTYLVDEEKHDRSRDVAVAKPCHTKISRVHVEIDVQVENLDEDEEMMANTDVFSRLRVDEVYDILESPEEKKTAPVNRFSSFKLVDQDDFSFGLEDKENSVRREETMSQNVVSEKDQSKEKEEKSLEKSDESIEESEEELDEEEDDLVEEEIEYEEEDEFEEELEDEEAKERDCLRMTFFNLTSTQVQDSDSSVSIDDDFVPASDSETEFDVKEDMEKIRKCHNPCKDDFFDFFAKKDLKDDSGEVSDMDYDDDSSTTVTTLTLASQDLASQEPEKPQERRRVSDSSVETLDLSSTKREYDPKLERIGDEEKTLNIEGISMDDTVKGEQVDFEEELDEESGEVENLEEESEPREEKTDGTMNRAIALESGSNLTDLMDNMTGSKKEKSATSTEKSTTSDVITTDSEESEYEVSNYESSKSSTNSEEKEKNGRGTYVVKKGVSSFRKLPVITNENENEQGEDEDLEETMSDATEDGEETDRNEAERTVESESWSETLKSNDRSKILINKSVSRGGKPIKKSGITEELDGEERKVDGNGFGSSSESRVFDLPEKDVKFLNEIQGIVLNKDNRIHLSRKLFSLFNKAIFEDKIPKSLQLEWNGRISKHAGLYVAGDTPKYDVIKLSSKILKTGLRAENTLLHEMCHAAVYRLDYSDEVHGPRFAKWVAKCAKTLPMLPVLSVNHNYDEDSDYTYICQDLCCGFRESKLLPEYDLQTDRCPSCSNGFLKVYRLGAPWKRARLNHTTGNVDVVLMES
ncbi:unnamed protein product [Bursaphelenchus xylophilus]|uniref:(pine wood nematode) hypothetical protein n=1 Tax=Bursaphelenchus xylophilus TaxID=6326 RepID=A0A1I7RTF4_BURXY|nr:unnamed protein product [Bursaphelenchus xylophilus]CAG9122474.1 unnamed protein product [Bursaphelenchus xylophilus]